jgi:hypothetical protein
MENRFTTSEFKIINSYGIYDLYYKDSNDKWREVYEYNRMDWETDEWGYVLASRSSFRNAIKVLVETFHIHSNKDIPIPNISEEEFKELNHIRWGQGDIMYLKKTDYKLVFVEIGG